MKRPGRQAARVRAAKGKRNGQRQLSPKPSRGFPRLNLEVYRLPDGEWIVASSGKPLTEDEAIKVLVTYQVVQQLMTRRNPERLAVVVADDKASFQFID
jgi:hypothetical protein